MKKLVNNLPTSTSSNTRPGAKFKYAPPDIDQNEAWAKIERLREIFEGKLDNQRDQRNRTVSSNIGQNRPPQSNGNQAEYSINASSTPRQVHPFEDNEPSSRERNAYPYSYSGTNPVSNQHSSIDSSIEAGSSVGLGKSMDFEQYSSRIYGRRHRVGADPELGDEPGVDEGLDIEYYPKLVSPGTILSERGTSRNNTSVEHRNERLREAEGSFESAGRAPIGPRRSKKRRALRNTGARYVQGVLGEPFPLPYIKKPAENPLVMGEPYSLLTEDKLNRKAREVKGKWKKLVLQDKIAVEKRMKELQDYETYGRSFSYRDPDSISKNASQRVNENSLSMSRSAGSVEKGGSPLTASTQLAGVNDQYNILPDMSTNNGAESYTEPENKEIGPFQALQDDILNNGKKLDLIIELLDKNTTGFPTNKGKRRWGIPRWFRHRFTSFQISKEDSFWIGCIILLIVFNVYVYYYF